MQRERLIIIPLLALLYLPVAGWLTEGRQPVLTMAREPHSAPVINEFVAANHQSLIDEDGDSPDWIEIYNPGSEAIHLAGWALTDDPHQPQKWSFPDISLAGRTYLIVFASGKDRKSSEPGSALHTNFKLDHNGEYLGLYHAAANRFSDIASASNRYPVQINQYVPFPKQWTDIAYGRYTHLSDRAADTHAYGYLTQPTPGEPNDETSIHRGFVDEVNFSAERGYYNAPFTLHLSSVTPGVTIRYTTDGSQPSDTQGVVYTAPITISTTTIVRAGAFKPDFLSAAPETHTYIFMDDVLTQSNTPSGFPKTWGGYQGVPVQADYEIDPEIVSDPRYKDVIRDALTAIPTLAIATEPHNFYELYANPMRRGRAWERPASVELFDPNDQQAGFQLNAGLRIQGKLGRLETMPKHSFRLFFRRQYGAAKLTYPLFPDSPVTEFETLILRGGVNKSYAGWVESDYAWATYTRDEWLRASQIAMSGSGAHGTFVHLYLNGFYWGLYNIVERPDADFMAAYFGGDAADWDSINHSETVSTSSERYHALHEMARAGQLDDPEKYAAIQSYLDIPHFIDYMILNWYSGNIDWGVNNWYAGVQNPGGQIRYYVWDGERTWFEGAEILMEEGDEYEGQPDWVTPLFNRLFENPDFRVMVADRVYKHLFNDGPLTPTNAQARWLNLAAGVEQAVIAESARWGDTREESPLTQEDWFEARDDVFNQMTDNATQFIRLAREQDYYPLLDPPIFKQPDNQPDGQLAAGITLTMTHPITQQGIIYYTTDGSDPRLAVSGQVAPTAKVYTHPLTLTSPTRIRARTFSDGEPATVWSALNEVVISPTD